MGWLNLAEPGSEGGSGAALPTDPLKMAILVVTQMGVFFLIFAACWWVSRVSRDQLKMRWSEGFWPLVRGMAYSIGLRISIAIGLMYVMLWILGVGAVVGGLEVDDMMKVRPDVEKLVDVDNLTNPVYMLMNLTVVSFFFAGFREELWRAGVLAAIAALFPRLYETTKGKMLAVFVVAVVFGLGHLPQGLGGVVLVTGLGVGLGAIMVFHRSMWDAVLAHGFFDATTFALLTIFPEILKDLLEKA